MGEASRGFKHHKLLRLDNNDHTQARITNNGNPKGCNKAFLKSEEGECFQRR